MSNTDDKYKQPKLPDDCIEKVGDAMQPIAWRIAKEALSKIEGGAS